ncbi:hypothetical protein PCANC_03258 [Puccinia coronata f. sp. avenae]|uniref:Uncharacterized protein n=1 Tax=Puccinia coronata f. sp. avenae TaxID=200324 RepID=A0A2N5VYW5_9BASI|nr:hypothetical protein PCANC_03258 [Puccinia coronata f. sp. avenae]
MCTIRSSSISETRQQKLVGVIFKWFSLTFSFTRAFFKASSVEVLGQPCRPFPWVASPDERTKKNKNPKDHNVFALQWVLDTAGINRSNTAVQAVLGQPCLTGGRTGTVRPKHLPPGRTGLSDQFLGPVAQDQPGPVGQICPTSWLLLRLDSARPTTG